MTPGVHYDILDHADGEIMYERNGKKASMSMIMAAAADHNDACSIIHFCGNRENGERSLFLPDDMI